MTNALFFLKDYAIRELRPFKMFKISTYFILSDDISYFMYIALHF